MTAPGAMPEPGANPLDTDAVRWTIAACLDHPSVYMGGPSRQSQAHAQRVVAALAPFVAAAQRAAFRAGVEAAAEAADWEMLESNALPDEAAYNQAVRDVMAAIRAIPTPAAFAVPEPSVAEALRPFAEIGQWLFARDLPDDTPLVEAGGINGYGMTLTRGHFKAAHRAFQALTEVTPEVAP